ncbi:hypothetical protein AAE478_002511 [Parahypoxylon ruwenzoriense]
MSEWCAQADQVWRDTFTNGPYTSLKMVEYLLRRARCENPYDMLIADPRLLRTISVQDIEADDMNGGLYSTWASRTGRCTSFAVKVSTLLQNRYPNVFQFSIYDLKGHRVARCRKTGVLIDSSSKHGAFILKEGEWKSFEDSDACWKWFSGKSKFETSKGPRKLSSDILSPKRSMAVCLSEVAAKSTCICLFRSMKQGKPDFYGMISWAIGKKQLEMVPDIHKRNDKVIVDWKLKGTRDDLQECTFYLVRFVTDYGGPLGERQWMADGINQINNGIWEAANKAWGCPKLRIEGKP